MPRSLRRRNGNSRRRHARVPTRSGVSPRHGPAAKGESFGEGTSTGRRLASGASGLQHPILSKKKVSSPREFVSRVSYVRPPRSRVADSGYAGVAAGIPRAHSRPGRPLLRRDGAHSGYRSNSLPPMISPASLPTDTGHPLSQGRHASPPIASHQLIYNT